MQRRENLRGSLAMGLYFNWVMYLLFYGPGLAVFAFDPSRVVLLGLISHIAGLLHSGWLYNRATSVRTLKGFDIACLALIVLVTAYFASARLPAPDTSVLPLFAAIGYASGRLMVRWGAWYCSPEAATRRGSIYGIMTILSYGMLFLQSRFLPPGPDGARIGLLCSIVTVLPGGLLIIGLPLAQGRRKRVSLSSIVPAAPVAAFSLIVFSLAILPFPFVLTLHTQYPLHLAAFIMVGYLVPLLLGAWSDRASRHCLLVASFTLLGAGFAIWTVTPHVPPFLLIVAVLVVAANLCASLFLWTSAADRAEPDTIPLGFAVAVSLQVTVHTLTFAALPYIDRSIFASPPFMGAAGVVLVLFGMGMLLISSSPGTKAVETISGPIGFLRVTGDDDYALPLVSLSTVLTDARMARIREMFRLTERESDIMTLVVKGFSNKQIAQRLYISLSTTKFHIRNILRKMGAADRQEMREKVFAQLSG
jgi:DNA-binding CsgD family transcriptional regulator